MNFKSAHPKTSKSTLPFKTSNKLRRQKLHVNRKKALESIRRDERLNRKRDEEKNPDLRRERLLKNIPQTIERKRVWDETDEVELGTSIDVEQLRKRQTEKAQGTKLQPQSGAKDEDLDSMLGSESDCEEKAPELPSQATAGSSSTCNLDLDDPESLLALKFPSLFTDTLPSAPKILITTSLNSTLHNEAELLCTLFPNSTYIRRSSHHYGHKYSLRDIAKFASSYQYTSIILLKEDQKKPTALSIVHLPSGPTCHFSVANWVEGKKLPGHGNPTNHYPELILNNFRTPLGLFAARLFLTLFPSQPEFGGRQVVTLHNQRDYIFVRRHRYIFREKRDTEKSVIGPDGKPVKGVEDIRAGLQELGPRFTLKLRRIDQGIGRAGSDGPDAVKWQWKAGMEKKRTRFNL